jgi:3-keto-5-aminohexanoate cleavage enzyme
LKVEAMSAAVQRVMIMVAPNGARLQKTDNPAMPITPAEIADAVVRCAEAGASIVHLHARNRDGSPTQSIETFREILDRIRARSDIVIQISLGTKGFTVEQALEPVDLRPDMVSLPLDGFMTDDAAARDDIRRMARYIRDRGVTPELTIYHERTLEGALELIAEGLIAEPASFLLMVRAPKSVAAGAMRLIGLAQSLPPAANWWYGGGGEHALELRSLAISLGGHVRVGFEDQIREFGSTRLAPSNAFLVERMIQLAGALGRAAASAKEARIAIKSPPLATGLPT